MNMIEAKRTAATVMHDLEGVKLRLEMFRLAAKHDPEASALARLSIGGQS